jgi:4a-hydroxytetrahydrobiopterin dehydratase
MNQPIPPQDVTARLARDLPAWSLKDGAIERVWRTNSWKGTLMLATTIGHFAEVAWHHPDLHLSWDRVTVRLNTHSAGGITEKDFALATKLEQVLSWRPGEENSPLEGTPADPAHAYLRP